MALEASAAGTPCAGSFSLKGDGRLASGEMLGEAITAVEEIVGKAGAKKVASFGVNCVYLNAPLPIM